MSEQLDINRRVLKKIVIELIKNSNRNEFEKNKISVMEKKEFENLEKIDIRTEKKPIKIKSIEANEKYLPLPKKPQIRRLIIPETKLPSHLQYLRPQPIQHSSELNLGKLTTLIKDLGIKNIECSGADQEIQINTFSGQKNSGMFLTEEEIYQILEEFSRESKIPLEEGIFRVVVGNLQLSAIISNTLGSKFIIKKIVAPNIQSYQTRKFTNTKK